MHALSFNMMAARFLSGASLFALLIVDICCFPYKKGSNPVASYGGNYPNAAPVLGSYQGAPSGPFSPAVVTYNAPSKGIPPSPQAEPQLGPSVPQPIAQRGPVSSVGSSSSGPVFSGYKDTSVKRNPASSAQPGAAFQPGPQGNWASPSLSGGEALSVYPVEPRPVEPMYKAGALSQFETSFDYGNNERETERQGGGLAPPLPPFLAQEHAGQGFVSQPKQDSNIGGSVPLYPFPYPYPNPYPYYDFMFLTGQYPPGTVSHASNSYDHGSNYYDDVHYLRDHRPHPVQQMQTFTNFANPQSFKDPYPVMAGYGQGGAQAGYGQGGTRQGGAQAGYGQGGAQAGYGQGGAQAGYGQGGAQAGYGQGGAQAGYGQGGAQAGYGQGGAQADGPASSHGDFKQPVGS